jgi:hypothetical protein
VSGAAVSGRGFSPTGWASLARNRRRQLLQVLLAEKGLELVRVDRRGDYDDLLLRTQPLLRLRGLRVRLMNIPATRDDILSLATLSAAEGMADYLLVGYENDAADIVSDDHYLAAEGVIELLEASALVRWAEGSPEPDRESFSDLRAQEKDLVFADTAGLRWLPSLALNKKPWELRESPESADDLFEQMFFRLMTTTFGLDGRRQGSSARGKRLPDGSLLLPDGEHILYDCKAARDGYVMTADHERRFVEYVAAAKKDGVGPRGPMVLLVVSSSFPGPAGARHPFHQRRRRLAVQGVALAYIRAIDLVAAALRLRPVLDIDSVAARQVLWRDALAHGLVLRTHLFDAHRPALPRPRPIATEPKDA